MSKKIAVIEDEPSISQLYKLKLTREGYDVVIAGNGRDGLALVLKERPDIILLDLLMPEMSGEEMLKALRKTEEGKHMKVIILTNVSRQEAPDSLDNLEISRYIVKAEYTPDQVAATVKSALAD